MSESTSTHAPSTSGRPHGAPAPQGPAIQRQFVNFAFYKLDPAFRRNTPEFKAEAHEEFSELFKQPRQGMICLSYSTAGLRPDCDFLLWRISLNADDFQSQTSAINKTRLGAYLTTPWSFGFLPKRRMYLDKVDLFRPADSRTRISRDRRKFLRGDRLVH